MTINASFSLTPGAVKVPHLLDKHWNEVMGICNQKTKQQPFRWSGQAKDVPTNRRLDNHLRHQWQEHL